MSGSDEAQDAASDMLDHITAQPVASDAVPWQVTLEYYRDLASRINELADRLEEENS